MRVDREGGEGRGEGERREEERTDGRREEEESAEGEGWERERGGAGEVNKSTI